MIANEERLALVLEANDRATATLQKVRKELELTGASVQRGRRGTGELGQAFDRVGSSGHSSLLKTSRAMQSIAYAADEAKLGTMGASRAMGQLAEGLASASGSTLFIGLASGIGAAVLAATTLYSLLQDSAEQMKPTEAYLRHLANISVTTAKAELENARKARDAAREQFTREASSGYLERVKRVGEGKTPAERLSLLRQGGTRADLMDKADANYQAALEKVLLIDKGERNHLSTLRLQFDQTTKQGRLEAEISRAKLEGIRRHAGQLSVETAAADGALKMETLRIEASARRLDINGKEIPLSAAEIRMQATLVGQAREKRDLAVAIATATQLERDTKALNASQSRLDALGDELNVTSSIERQHNAILRQYSAESDALGPIQTLNEYQLEQLRQMGVIREGNLKLLEREFLLRGTLSVLERGSRSENVGESYSAQMKLIEAQRLEDIKKNGYTEVEATARAEEKKRQLRKQTTEQTKRDFRTVEDVLLASNSRQIKAVGHAVQTIRRLEIGVEGSKAAVKALREGAESLASFAMGDFRGGALHLASAAQFAAVAALAAQESLGGGSSAGGGGGGGGGTSGAGTFEPRSSTEGQGALVLNVYSQNPYGAEQIQSVQYLLNRAEILKRPAAIQIAPTNGLRVA